MDVTYNMPISSIGQALSPAPAALPHAAAQANSEAVKAVSPERGRPPTAKISEPELAERMQASVEEMNAQLKLANHSIRFSIDERTNDLVVKVVDTKTDQIIKQIPPEQVLRLREHMQDLAGMIVAEVV